MGLSLLAPLFLAGLAALAVPLWIHLTAGQRRDVRRFPSLKFLTRVPYRQVRRRRLRHRFLLALRALAMGLLVLAFARPLVGGGGRSEVASEPGREVVVALDRSYSMTYGDTWERAVEATRDILGGLRPGDRVALLTFAEEARVAVPPTADFSAVVDVLLAATPGAGSTRFAPALRLADRYLLDSSAAERQVVLVSDLQANAWDLRAAGRYQTSSGAATLGTATLSPGVRLTTVDLSTAEPLNVLIASVEARAVDNAGVAQVVIEARLVNRGATPASGLPVTLTLDGQEVASEIVDLPPAAGEIVRLGPIAQPAAVARATVRIRHDQLTADDTFHLTVAAEPALQVLLLEAPNARPEASLYLRRALTISPGESSGRSPAASDLVERAAFEITALPVDRLGREAVEAAAVVILHDSPWPTGAAARALVEHVGAGGGLWMILGGRSGEPAGTVPAAGSGAAGSSPGSLLLPGSWSAAVDRLQRHGVSLATIDYDHPAFAVFAGAGDGNLTGPRFYRYRPISIADGAATAAVVARYTDGAVALAERRYGSGRVLLWGSPFDNRWSNLPLQPVFLPFVHQVCRYLGGRQARVPWRRVGEVLDLRQGLGSEPSAAGLFSAEAVEVVAPSGRRETIEPGGEAALVRLSEAGFYELHAALDGSVLPVAVNVDRTESDLTPLDAAAFVAASTTLPDGGSAAAAAGGLRLETRQQRERRQGAWWTLLLCVLLLLTAESLWSNRAAQGHPAPSVAMGSARELAPTPRSR